jgi:AbrB family looped-hinge helix DNA binding protein
MEYGIGGTISCRGNGVEKHCLCHHVRQTIILQYRYRWSLRMEAVKVSPKFQVVIPKKLRDALKLSPGQRVQMIAYDNRIEMIPLRKISDMKGFLKGIDSTVEREPDRI